MVNSLSEEQKKYLEKKYTNTSFKGAFTSAKNFYRAIKNDGKYDNISLAQINRFLSSLSAFTLHRERRRSRKFMKIISAYKLHIMGADLIDYTSIAKFNKGKKFCLIMQDFFTRKIFLKALPSKKGKAVLNAIKEIYRQTGRYDRLCTDQGKEFQFHGLHDFLNSKGIKHYYAVNPETSKVSNIERTIKTVRKLISKYFTFTGKKIWYKKVGNFARIFNSSYHRVIKTTPAKAWSGETPATAIWENVFMPPLKKSNKTKIIKTRKNKRKLRMPRYNFKFSINDVVKVSQEKNIYSRHTSEGYSRENFRIQEREMKAGIRMYRLKDMFDTPLKSFFRESELKLSSDNDKYQVYELEKVLKKQKRGKVVYVLAKWVGLPKQNATWVREKDLK